MMTLSSLAPSVASTDAMSIAAMMARSKTTTPWLTLRYFVPTVAPETDSAMTISWREVSAASSSETRNGVKPAASMRPLTVRSP